MEEMKLNIRAFNWLAREKNFHWSRSKMSILPKICSRMFDRLEKSLVNIKFISISTNIDTQSYLLQPYQFNLINFLRNY